MADLSRSFFQVVVPEAQRDLLRIIWFRNNDLEGGELQVFRFSRHVWGGINSSAYIAVLAIKTLIAKNPTQASTKTLNAINDNRYIDDILFSCDNLSNFKDMSHESIALFKKVVDLNYESGFLIRARSLYCRRFLNLTLLDI